MTLDQEVLLSREDLAKTITRMAHELIEKAGAIEELALIGIRSRGVHLARRLARKIEELTGKALPLGIIDVTHFRDDRRRDSFSNAGASEEIPVTVENKTAVRSFPRTAVSRRIAELHLATGGWVGQCFDGHLLIFVGAAFDLAQVDVVYRVMRF